MSPLSDAQSWQRRDGAVKLEAIPAPIGATVGELFAALDEAVRDLWRRHAGEAAHVPCEATALG